MQIPCRTLRKAVLGIHARMSGTANTPMNLFLLLLFASLRISLKSSTMDAADPVMMQVLGMMTVFCRIAAIRGLNAVAASISEKCPIIMKSRQRIDRSCMAI